jgi:hypothetical protein
VHQLPEKRRHIVSFHFIALLDTDHIVSGWDDGSIGILWVPESSSLATLLQKIQKFYSADIQRKRLENEKAAAGFGILLQPKILSVRQLLQLLPPITQREKRESTELSVLSSALSSEGRSPEAAAGVCNVEQ